MIQLTEEQIKNAIAHFQFPEVWTEAIPYGSGHINDTILVRFPWQDGLGDRAILQRIQHETFKEPEKLMDNIYGVTTFLRKKIIEAGGDPDRETLNIIPAKDGKALYHDEWGNYWRAYKFIYNTISYDVVERKEDFYESAVAFGHFQKLLSDYPAHTLHESIPGFHDTVKRLAAFKEAVQSDPVGRVKSVEKEIQFVYQRERIASCFGELLEKGEIPLRVTHNDTKLNNIMIDQETGKGICVVDLDTVMPGLAMNDFGDSIRFGANKAAEDERDLSKVTFDLELYECYVKGFLEECGESLTEKEIRLLPMGALVMTYECGMRFLMDHIQGDVYFKIHRENHNLDRCRTQFRLVEQMEEKWKQMQTVVEKYM